MRPPTASSALPASSRALLERSSSAPVSSMRRSLWALSSICLSQRSMLACSVQRRSVSRLAASSAGWLSVTHGSQQLGSAGECTLTTGDSSPERPALCAYVQAPAKACRRCSGCDRVLNTCVRPCSRVSACSSTWAAAGKAGEPAGPSSLAHANSGPPPHWTGQSRALLRARQPPAGTAAPAGAASSGSHTSPRLHASPGQRTGCCTEISGRSRRAWRWGLGEHRLRLREQQAQEGAVLRLGEVHLAILHKLGACRVRQRRAALQAARRTEALASP